MPPSLPAKREQPIFYVYEHWRPDTDQCFWVGKGHADRAYRWRDRNCRYGNIVRKLRASGLDFEVRLVETGLTEDQALALEIMYILKHRLEGSPLCNATIGGEGCTGLTHTADTRARLSAIASISLIGRPVSAETRQKLSDSNRRAKAHLVGGKNPEHSMRMKGRKHTEEHKAAISAAMRGRPCSLETRRKIADAQVGKHVSDETRERLRQAHLGHKPSPETSAKRSASLKAAWARRKAVVDG